MAPEIGILGLVPDVWGDVWMPRHHVLTRLARYFNVVWVDPPREWRDTFRSERSDRRDFSPDINTDVPEIEGFRLYRPGRLLPFFYRPRSLAALATRVRLRQARRLLERAGARRMVLYIWRPEFEYALGDMPEALSLYHVDDEYSFSTADLPTHDSEAALLRRADMTVLHSPGLWEKKAALTPSPSFVPNGADYAAWATPREEPADLRAIPHPRIGYVGVIKPFLNMPLLLELATRHPEWSFVLVGPVRPLGPDAAAFEELRQRPNTYLVGGRPVQALPAYTQHLDVGIMPYDVDGYTKFIYPLKLHEYLAAGLPVVASPIRTLQDFRSVVTLADGPDQWSAAITAALGPGARHPDAVAVRRAVAAEYDWNLIVHRIAMILAERLGPEVREVVAAAAPGNPRLP